MGYVPPSQPVRPQQASAFHGPEYCCPNQTPRRHYHYEYKSRCGFFRPIGMIFKGLMGLFAFKMIWFAMHWRLVHTLAATIGYVVVLAFAMAKFGFVQLNWDKIQAFFAPRQRTDRSKCSKGWLRIVKIGLWALPWIVLFKMFRHCGHRHK
ncbi:hypothetical protein Ae201684_005714 [Aphanomyces euteiches]|uniref:Uncharacterized protein n=1 Tax=Aphanomyces euteiches TaxID=100861 RepID=A0A6G0XE78_9STRA|nr:hypothetical protein Ae201684_005714 [Aphanomyces euteiches]